MRKAGRARSVGLLVTAFLGAGSTFPGVAAAVPPTTNIGLAAEAFQFTGGRVALSVSESAQGGVDRNGDGDASDRVLAVHDAITNTTTNVGLATSDDPQIRGDLVAFVVHESSQGASDRNGDGDASDGVLAVYDAATDTTTNVGVGSFGGFQIHGERVAFLVYEGSQGGLDRNGDGDAEDFVPALYDAATGTVVNVGLATRSVRLEGERIFFLVSESEQGGLDRNGDGDTADNVLAVYDAGTNATTNVGIAAQSHQPGGDRVASFISESSEGGFDRNGDGDAIDFVPAVHDAATGTTANVGLATSTMSFDGDRAVFLVPEASQGGVDRNGDGDTGDSVPAVYDAATDTTANVGLAAENFGFDGQTVAISVPESGQGGLDRNGDGDTGDSVLAVYDGATNMTANVGVGMLGGSLVRGGRVAFIVYEPQQGGLDRNGDGDANDSVLGVYDVVTRVTTNIELATDIFQIDGERVALLVQETGQGSLDRNGDADATDYVLAVYDAATDTTTNVGLVTRNYRVVGDRVAFLVSESGQGGLDRNGDGDATDLVLAIYKAGDAGDVTAPATTILLGPTAPDGQNGWYVSGVTVTVATADETGGSGVAETRCVVDPASPPATFDDIPSGCAYTAGAVVSTDSDHAIYASSRDVAGNSETPVLVTFGIDTTDPAVTCDVASPGPAFVLQGSGGIVGATVTDATSGPLQDEAALADVATVGNKTVLLTGQDLAGNATTVPCAYQVSYRFLGFQNLKSSYKSGSGIAVKFKLANAGGSTISDAAAKALLVPCRVRVTLDGIEQPGCASYNASTNTFQYTLKTSKSLAVGPHALAVEVGAPDGSGVVNTNGTSITIVKR